MPCGTRAVTGPRSVPSDRSQRPHVSNEVAFITDAHGTLTIELFRLLFKQDGGADQKYPERKDE